MIMTPDGARILSHHYQPYPQQPQHPQLYQTQSQSYLPDNGNVSRTAASHELVGILKKSK